MSPPLIRCVVIWLDLHLLLSVLYSWMFVGEWPSTATHCEMEFNKLVVYQHGPLCPCCLPRHSSLCDFYID